MEEKAAQSGLFHMLEEPGPAGCNSPHGRMKEFPVCAPTEIYSSSPEKRCTMRRFSCKIRLVDSVNLLDMKKE
ncbi:MAG: hypothetical protein IJE07_00070 [Clostridia bacterium]|nr:hypothetical protein [Clostridia bacterium]